MRLSPALTLLLLACGPAGRGFNEVEPDLFIAEVSDFDASFDETGMSAVSRRDRIGLSLEGAEPVAPALIDCPPAASCDQQLTYDRGDHVEWWRHRGGGLQHGFTLYAPLDTPDTSGETVVISLIVTGARPRATAQGVLLRTGTGELWRYERLRVRDAGGRALPSEMAVVDDRIELRFDATGARYPVEVDPSLTADEAQILPSDVAPGLAFGEVVASGDINGDGYDDLAVGASASDRRGSSAGEAYLYEGGPDGIDTSTEVTVFASDASSSDLFGRGVQLDADIDGDGDVELIVGAPAGNGLVSSSGKLYVYEGTGAGIDTSAETEIYASDGMASDHYGSPVSTPGDMNGDGLDDVAVRAYGHPALYAYFGSSTGLTDELKIDPSDYGLPNMGQYLSADADVNGDGYEDLLVGCPDRDGRSSGTGTLYIFHGQSTGLDTGSPEQVYASDGGSTDKFGPVASAGDLDADGYDDIVVGAYQDDDTASNAGAVYLYPGSSLGVASAYEHKITASTGTSSDNFGIDVAATGSGVLVGAYKADGAAAGSGVLYAYDADASTLVDSATEKKYTATEAGASDLLGEDIQGLYDVNGDGVNDWIAGATSNDDGASGGGAVFVLEQELDEDDDGYGAGDDCDDADDSVHPGATEACDGIDNDCDEDTTDECWSPDADGDGYGDPATRVDAADAGTGYVDNDEDCDDADASVHPGATETAGDEFDQDCDGEESCYQDLDEDGVRTDITVRSSDTDCSDPIEATSGTPDEDCDDTDANVYPGAPEIIADGVDQDCDGLEDCYIDADADGYRPDDTPLPSEDLDCTGPGEADASTPDGDCDDADASVSPDADEAVGDEIDQDCDGIERCYADLDDDGYRPDETSEVDSPDASCGESGEARADEPIGDCDDANAAAYPGAEELIADDIDEDCDGGELCLSDADGDGYRPDDTTTTASEDAVCDAPGEAGWGHPSGDCDDDASTVYPGAPEVVSDGIDQDCDGLESCYADADEDGYRPDDTPVSSLDLDCAGPGEADASAPDGDCDDADASVSPAADEAAGDEIDQDCDGLERCYADLDDDGYRPDETSEVESLDSSCAEPGEARADEPAGDCDDDDATAYPGATELVADEIDQDCDGGELCLSDADADGYRPDDATTTVSADAACDAAGEAGWGHPSEDCDDADASIYPGATEIIGDEIDQDCDGLERCYADLDDDSYRPDETSEVASTDASCGEPGEARADEPTGDCNDADASIWPGADEVVADEIDQDCDGGELCLSDSDADGYRPDDSTTTVSADTLCDGAGEAGWGHPSEDCDDADASVYPGAPELSDGIDNDCNGYDELVDADSDDLTAYDEAALGTDPNDADSDDDGLSDGDEVHEHGTDPLATDTDADGLSDAAEVGEHGTSPTDADSDDDGLDDRAEVEDHGTDPLNADTDGDALSDAEEIEVTDTDPLDADTDDDSLSDGDEVGLYGTDPSDGNSDDDGLLDGEEVMAWHTDPLDADTDDDGLLDGEEVEVYSTDPLDEDSDGDTLSDYMEVFETGTDANDADTDDDRLDDAAELNTWGTDPRDPDTDDDGVDDRAEVEGTGTDPRDEDSDDDGLTDGEEIITWHTDPLSADSDGDGLGDADEINVHGTNPNAADTDGGSVSDADELEAGTDPLVASDDLGNTVTKNRGCATGSGGGLWGVVVAALLLVRRLAARPAPREGEACPSSPASPTCPCPASGSAPSTGRPRRRARSIR